MHPLVQRAGRVDVRRHHVHPFAHGGQGCAVAHREDGVLVGAGPDIVFSKPQPELYVSVMLSRTEMRRSR